MLLCIMLSLLLSFLCYHLCYNFLDKCLFICSFFVVVCVIISLQFFVLSFHYMLSSMVSCFVAIPPLFLKSLHSPFFAIVSFTLNSQKETDIWSLHNDTLKSVSEESLNNNQILYKDVPYHRSRFSLLHSFCHFL
jgi:hypothetical protein